MVVWQAPVAGKRGGVVVGKEPILLCSGGGGKGFLYQEKDNDEMELELWF